MEIDLLALVIVIWAGCLGWKRRGLNALMDFMSISVLSVILMEVIPLSENFLIGKELQLHLIEWVQNHLSATTPASAIMFHTMREIPVGTGMYNRDIQFLQLFYKYCMTTIMGVTVFISIQMVRQSFLTIWPPRQGLWDSRYAGAIISSMLGVYVALYCIAVLGVVTWFEGFTWLDQSLQHSLFSRFITIFNPW